MPFESASAVASATKPPFTQCTSAEAFRCNSAAGCRCHSTAPKPREFSVSRPAEPCQTVPEKILGDQGGGKESADHRGGGAPRWPPRSRPAPRRESAVMTSDERSGGGVPRTVRPALVLRLTEGDVGIHQSLTLSAVHRDGVDRQTVTRFERGQPGDHGVEGSRFQLHTHTGGVGLSAAQGRFPARTLEPRGPPAPPVLRRCWEPACRCPSESRDRSGASTRGQPPWCPWHRPHRIRLNAEATRYRRTKMITASAMPPMLTMRCSRVCKPPYQTLSLFITGDRPSRRRAAAACALRCRCPRESRIEFPRSCLACRGPAIFAIPRRDRGAVTFRSKIPSWKLNASTVVFGVPAVAVPNACKVCRNC